MSRTACQQVLCIVVWLVCISQADTFASSLRKQAARGVGFISALRMPNAGLEHVMVHKPFTSIAGQKDTAGARVLGGHLFGSLCFLGAAQARGMPRGRGRTLSGLQMGGFSRSNSGSDHEESADEVFTNGVDGEWRREEWEQLPKIFVLLFNPRTDNEGICEGSIPYQYSCHESVPFTRMHLST